MNVNDIPEEMARTIYDMYDRKCTAATIARTAGLPYETVRRLLAQKYGELRRSGNRENRRVDIIAAEWNSGTTNLKLLAQKHNCSEYAVRSRLYQSGISSRKPRDDRAIVRAYNAGEPLSKIANDFGISKSTVYLIIGDERRGQIPQNHGMNNELRNAISGADKSERGWQSRIAEAFGVSRQRVCRIWSTIKEDGKIGEN